jgi:hypothetical protein
VVAAAHAKKKDDWNNAAQKVAEKPLCDAAETATALVKAVGAVKKKTPDAEER